MIVTVGEARIVTGACRVVESPHVAVPADAVMESARLPVGHASAGVPWFL